MRTTRGVLVGSLLAGGVVLGTPQLAEADTFKSASECRLGRHVAGNDNGRTVVGVTQGTECEVRNDGSGDTHY